MKIERHELHELTRIQFVKIREIRVKGIFVAERRGKLASYEVAGVGGENEFVPQGTMESIVCFPASFQDAMICGCESSHNVAG
jgi:hypothetical protein